jgi:hypothetical protein
LIFRTKHDGSISGNIGLGGFKDREHLSSSSKPRFQASFPSLNSKSDTRAFAQTGSFQFILLPVSSADGPRPRGATAAWNAQTGAVMTGS